MGEEINNGNFKLKHTSKHQNRNLQWGAAAERRPEAVATILMFACVLTPVIYIIYLFTHRFFHLREIFSLAKAASLIKLKTLSRSIEKNVLPSG